MWRSVVVVAVLAAAVTCSVEGARYGDYSGVKMPLYGGTGEYDAPGLPHAGDADTDADGEVPHPEADDYRGHSPDAPASPDYKYEEEDRGNAERSSSKNSDSGAPQKPIRKQRRWTRTDIDDYSEFLDKRSGDDVIPKFKTSRRYRKQRPRLKNSWNSEKDFYSRAHAPEYKRDDKDETSYVESEDEFLGDKYFAADSRKNIENRDKQYSHRKTADKIVRRKPRDRMLDRKDDLVKNRMKEELERDPLLSRLLKENVGSDRESSTREKAGRRRPADDRPLALDLEDEAVLRPLANVGKTREYDSYNDYYDMKRVQNIKSKLPKLLRRTKARAAAPRPTSRVLDDIFPNWPDDSTTTPASGGYEDIYPNRRVFELTSLPKVDPMLGEATHQTQTTTTTTASITTTTSNPITVQKSTKEANISRELSLAEKSRLSILKKAQMKEILKEQPPTKKPPVLLQVTKRLPTLVMVEPPTSQEPWMRAREITDDSPQRLEKVKQLMRRKLVANARSINDLTENWDDMVCDYVDMSLLENSTARLRPRLILYLPSILAFYIKYGF